MISGLGVVVPVHGRVEPVLDLIEDILASGDDARPERCLLVDDASPEPIDGAALPASIELIRRTENGGFGAAVNTGLQALAESGCELALVLNSDLRLPRGFCAQIVQDARPWQPAVVGCRTEDADGRSGYAARFFPTIRHQVVEWLVPLASQRHRDVLHRAVGHDLDAERGTGMLPVDWVSGAAMLLPIREVLAAGGFDEGYFMYTEEVDLQLRLRERGVPALFDADLTVIHAGGGSSGGEARRRRWLVGARMRYARKHGHPLVLRSAMTAATGANLVWNSGRRLAGRDVRPLDVAREELSLIHRAGKDLPR